MRRYVTVILYALAGWAVCGATVVVGRRFLSMDAVLLAHAVVAPVAFGVLTWRYFRRFPEASPAGTSLAMIGGVAGLDAFVVAPFLERSYAMFRSALATWIPFASIGVVSYLVGRACGENVRGGHGAE